MRVGVFYVSFLCLVLLAAALIQIQEPIPNNQVPTTGVPEAIQTEVLKNYGKLPLYFIENRGRLDSRVAYYIQGRNKSIYFSADGVTFALSNARNQDSSSNPLIHPASYQETSAGTAPFLSRLGLEETQRWVVKLDFVGANPDARPVGQDPTDAVISYFQGRQEEWTTGLPTYAEIVYRDLWPGIDLVYTGTGSRLKYTFLVHPGADPSQIRMAYRGASGVQINAAGQLEVSTPVESFHEEKPYVYQEVNGQEREVEAEYALDSQTSDGVQFGFRVGDYDRSKVLVLDPVVFLYAGFIGGSGYDAGYGIAVDGLGSAYVAGLANSFEGSFPVTVGPDLSFNGGSFDAFVAKVNPAGTALVYAGYIGGAGENDYGLGIAVDGSGNAYVTGQTDSSEATFPVTVGPDPTYNGGTDAFVAKVNAAGTALVYAGYIGGAGFEFGSGIAVDTSGNAYVTGSTSSSEFGNVSSSAFPIRVGPDLSFNGDQDAFVAKVNAAGSALIYAGYIGGSGFDVGYRIAVDATGNAYVAGETNSDEGTFPVTVGPDPTYNGGTDAFVAKVNAAGTALVYAGYIGGNGFDAAYGIAVDRFGNAHATGAAAESLFETPFPTRVGPDRTYNGGDSDAFVAKVNAAGTALEYSGYIGGADVDIGRGIAVDGSGNAYVTGETASADTTFPVTDGPDLTDNGEDAFVAKVDPSGTLLLYAGFIGGVNVDVGRAIAVDASGNAYVTGDTLSTQATFPATVGPDLTYNTLDDPTFRDAFVAKIGEQPPNPVPTLTSLSTSSVSQGSPGGTLTLNGSNFLPSSEVRWNGSARNRTFVSSSVLTTFVSSSELETARTVQVTVFNPPPGGGTSAARTFTITAPTNPAPTLTSLSPSSATRGGAGFSLSVAGTNFLATALVRWNGTDRATTFVSNSALTAAIPASDITATGTAQVTVFNPGPGGGTSAPISFAITEPVLLPSFIAAGLVNAASYTAGTPAGGIATIFGSRLSSGISGIRDATSLPLPTELGGTKVTINGITAPLFAVVKIGVSEQINFQIPWGVLGLPQVTMTVTAGNLASPPVTLNLPAYAPGIFTINSQGTGQGAILISATGEFAAPVGSVNNARPASRGEFITIYCSGLGNVTNRPASGAAASGNPLSATTETPTVTIGGVPAPVSFSGLAPGFVGLYQINVQVPSNAPTSGAVPVVATIGGVSSNTVTIAVQ